MGQPRTPQVRRRAGASPLTAAPGADWSAVLRAIRAVRGVTQEGFAAELGYSRRTVRRWEGGAAVPDAAAEQALLHYCRQHALFRRYDHGPLQGLTLTPELLRDLLAEARLSAAATARPHPVPLEIATTRVPPTNLPAALTSFVGRQPELAALQELVGATRLLTLTGTGGVGKTRLALELAADRHWSYRDGVWLVELAALTDPALVPKAVAGVLGVREQPGHSPTVTLTEALAPRHLLLVLDNCEHLVAACASLVDTLLRACPSVQILATSREPLRTMGETVWTVPPLSLPDAEQGTSLARLSESDAVQLFVERARAGWPGFGWTDAQARAVFEVCRRLDGIPLAVELAAARVSALGVEQLAARLDDCFRLLSAGSRTALPRQQTLRATLDWSYDLLTEPERIVLRRLAVFAGGWRLEAAEPICAGDGLDGAAVVDLLTHLVDKSLVLVEEQGEGVQYWLLETVRRYAQEKLAAAGETAALRERHRDWYLGLAEHAVPELTGSDQGLWVGRLDREHDNLRAALSWSTRAPEDGVRPSG